MEPFFNTSIEILTSFRIKLKLISFSPLFTFLDGFPFFVFSQWISTIQQGMFVVLNGSSKTRIICTLEKKHTDIGEPQKYQNRE